MKTILAYCGLAFLMLLLCYSAALFIVWLEHFGGEEKRKYEYPINLKGGYMACGGKKKKKQKK